MARVAINTGAAANDGTGDTLRAAGGIINDNFLEVYSYLGAGSTTTLSAPIWDTTDIGISTLRNVGIGTTNPRFSLEIGSVGYSGTSLYVNGDTRITGILTVGTSSITLDGTNDSVTVGSGLTFSGISTSISIGSQLTIDGSTGSINAVTASFSGNVSIGGTLTYEDVTNIDSVGLITARSGIIVDTGGIIVTDGISTFSGGLSSINVSGISTFSSTVDFSGTDNINALTRPAFFDSVTINSASPGIGVVIDNTGFYRARVDDISGSKTSAVIVGSSGSSTAYTLYNNGDVDTSGIIAATGLNISGVSTFSDLDINGNIDIDSNSVFYSEATNTLKFSDDVAVYFGTGSDGYVAYQNANNSLHIRTPGGTAPILIGSGTEVKITNQDGTVDRATFTGIGVSIVGIVTAISGIVTYYGDTSYTADGRWVLGANGTSDYTFTGIGFTQTTNDPLLYLARGRVYEFVNDSGGAHPFEIRVSDGGSAYVDGITNNSAASGVIRFEVPFNAPNTLYYQCTSHSGMGNTITIYPTI